MVTDKFGSPIDIGCLVAISTNSGMYLGRVTKFNYYPGTLNICSVQCILTSGRKQSYDGPQWRMINLDEVHDRVRDIGF